MNLELKTCRIRPWRADDAASVRVLEKAGFTYDGRLRSHVLKDGQVLDALVYAKLRDGFGPNH